MRKKKFIMPHIEILMFDDEDVLLGTSSTPDDGYGEFTDEFEKKDEEITVKITAPEIME